MFVDFNILNQLGSPSINSNTFANRPAAGQTGRLFVSTDTFEIYRDNGTTWDLIGGPGSSTITGTGTATQVAYFTSSQAIGSSANLFWDNTSGFLGVATATPSATIEAVKTDGVGIYANFTTNAGSGSSTTALWAKNVTNSSGFAAVIEETTPNTTAGQYPLLIKHSLSSGTAGVGMGTGIHWQLPDNAGTFKTTQLTVETIDAAAATYATRYRFNVQSNGSSTPVAYINATGLGIFTATPSAALDIHSTGTMARLNSTSATGNSLLAFQRTGTGLWRIGDFYNGGANYFEIHNTVLNNNAVEINAATNKSIFTALETYTTGLARGNYFDYNLSVSAGGSFSSPNAITALGASLDLTLAGSATIPSGARSGLDAYNSIAFTGAGTLTHTQGTQIRAYSNLTAGWAFNGTATGTITHLAGLRALFPDNTGSAVTVTNNYALLLNDQTANTGTVTYTNRWGVYQEGASDLNYFAANTLIKTTNNGGESLQVNGSVRFDAPTGSGTNTAITSRYGTDNNYKLELLQVVSAGLVKYAFQVTNGGTSYANNLVLTNGLVGIGTVTPLAPLHVQGSAALMERTTTATTGERVSLQIRASSTGSTADGFGPQLVFSLTDAESIGTELASISAVRAGADNTGDLTFITNNAGVATQKMRITSAGLVGIGLTAPLSKLHISGSGSSAQSSLQISNTTQNTTFYYTASNSVAIGYIGSQTNHPIAFTTNDTEKARITAGGNFLIGTTTDAGQKLQVAGTADITQPVTVNSSASNSVGLTIRGNIGPGLRQNFINNDSSGLYNFQIGTNITAVNVFEVRASTGADGTSFSTISRINTTGDITVTGSYTSAAPSGGTAAAWKLGSYKAASVTLNTSNYIEVDIGGTLYKLAVVT